jgi:hypothetical protein
VNYIFNTASNTEKHMQQPQHVPPPRPVRPRQRQRRQEVPEEPSAQESMPESVQDPVQGSMPHDAGASIPHVAHLLNMPTVGDLNGIRGVWDAYHKAEDGYAAMDEKYPRKPYLWMTRGSGSRWQRFKGIVVEVQKLLNLGIDLETACQTVSQYKGNRRGY